MKKEILKLSLVAITLISIISCSSDDTVIGSGNIIEQDRNLVAFDKIFTPSSVNVSIVYGTTQSVIVSADDNIINDVKTFVSNATIEVGLQEGNYNNITVNVTITTPNIVEIVNTGSGNISASGFIDLNNLTFTNSGSGNIVLSGSGIDFSIQNSGSGSINSFGFVSENCVVNHSGSGSSEISCTTNLSGSLSGSGSIYYKGTPTISISNTGSGSVVDSN